MKTNIVEIDGKHYLELPCLPGQEVYSVYPHINNKFERTFKIYPERYATVHEIVRDIKLFGVNTFLTKEEAEVHKKELEEEQQRKEDQHGEC